MSCSVWSWIRLRRWWQWENRHVVDSELLPRARKLFYWLPCSMIFDIYSNLLGSLLLKRVHTINMSVQKVNKVLLRSCMPCRILTLVNEDCALKFEQQKSRKAVTSCHFVTGRLCISVLFSFTSVNALSVFVIKVKRALSFRSFSSSAIAEFLSRALVQNRESFSDFE